MANIVDERGYNQIYAHSKAQTLRLQRRAAAMVEAMHLPGTAVGRDRVHILEIGCGTGELAHLLATATGARVTGVDLSPQFISQASARHIHPNLDFAVVDLLATSPAAESDRYDFIVGNGILHHLHPQLDTVLRRFTLWLRPGGRLVFWEPNLLNPYVYLIFSFKVLRRWARLEPGEMAFSAGQIRRRLTGAGYNELVAEPRDFLLPNTPAALLAPVVRGGALLERLPLLRHLAQSVFLHATWLPAGSQDQRSM